MRGFTIADLSLAGNEPLFRDILTISVMYGASCGRNCTTSEIGAGSRRQVAFGDQDQARLGFDFWCRLYVKLKDKLCISHCIGSPNT